MAALPERQCPWCGADVDESDDATGDKAPTPGAASLCYGCLRFSLFEPGPHGLRLRRATPTEARLLRGQPEVQTVLRLARADPLRTMRGPGDADRLVARWRRQLILDAPLPQLPSLGLSGGDPAAQ